MNVLRPLGEVNLRYGRKNERKLPPPAKLLLKSAQHGNESRGTVGRLATNGNWTT